MLINISSMIKKIKKIAELFHCNFHFYKFQCKLEQKDGVL